LAMLRSMARCLLVIVILLMDVSVDRA